jgi:kynurenine 3-monooxygenase
MLMALPNLDGSFTVTLYLPWDGPGGFDAIDRPERVLRLFEEHFPDAIPLIDDLPGQFLGRPTGSLGTVRCRPWHHDGRLLLLGDAAHAIVPFFGQGMNAGFEDCTVLDELLEETRGSWPAVLPEFERRRKPDTDAIADLALDNFVEMRDRTGDPRFLLRKRIEQRLERELRGEYRSRYALVMYTHVPYRVALAAGRVQERILDELCAGVAEPGAADLERARSLVRRELAPVLEPYRADL